MTLLGFARFYDSIHSMLPSDRPTDDVIEDDAALDKWYQDYVREQARKAAKTSTGSMDVQVPQFSQRDR